MARQCVHPPTTRADRSVLAIGSQQPRTPTPRAEPDRGATATASATASAVAPSTPVDGVTGAWRDYRNEQAGYRAAYPAAWTASERADANGALTTSFGPADGGAGIGVIVQPGRANVENTDLPNTRCSQVVVGGATGRRCFDTLSSSVTTTLVAHDKTYTIVAAGRRLDQQIYQRFLDSFALLP